MYSIYIYMYDKHLTLAERFNNTIVGYRTYIYIEHLNEMLNLISNKLNTSLCIDKSFR